ncbi:MAG: hypothetical protein E7A72_09620 [Actinomyces urogenitalis]|uniref:Uncharacterized protein n=2 Tax=Actinomyces urogenitalis TaxID=103621 RepID=A0A2I1KQU3_9ACTO|nr:hypothetical protein [Actinomyces urogenitalis]MBS6071994.1 hypothetical protein [Actinomyces urogenitalis]MDU0863921.1 hypothetical protein [Actinomyces urogenitalis]MDU0874648.1 hypothetical protein [Actinomyces urogenitalis]MDU0973131.1 hypothetical protein [Actinomyces urogenitalis]MDU1564306.1 hypothetical protein [Actinomyces urogenitalis]
MNDPAPKDGSSQAAPAGEEIEVPQWINDLVPVAERARPVLLGELVYLVMALVLLALIWDADPLGLGLPQAILLALVGYAYALRCGGARRRLGQADSPAPLRAGAYTTMLVLVADLVCSALGLAVWVMGALRGSEHPLEAGALAAAVAMTTAVAGVLACEVPSTAPRWLAPAAQLAGLLAVVCLTLAVLSTQWINPWWWVLALAIVTDLLGLLAIRAGRRRDRGERA